MNHLMISIWQGSANGAWMQKKGVTDDHIRNGKGSQYAASRETPNDGDAVVRFIPRTTRAGISRLASAGFEGDRATGAFRAGNDSELVGGQTAVDEK